MVKMKIEISMNQNRINSLTEFIRLENRYYNGSKPTVFALQTGAENEREFLEEIYQADLALADIDKTSKNWYYRGGPLETYMDNEKRTFYESVVGLWCKQGKGAEKKLKFQFENGMWDELFGNALEQVCTEYRKQENNEKRYQNFLLLLFFRIDYYFPKLFKNTRIVSKFPKFVYTGVCNNNEYFFLKLLSLCGCDVYALHPNKTLALSETEISASVQLVRKNVEVQCKIPPYDIEKIKAEKAAEQQRMAMQQRTTMQQPDTNQSRGVHLQRTRRGAAVSVGVRRELSYEELAGMAGSVVMIVVFNEMREPFASGSGVLINNQGYILTNFHVIQGAAAFGVRLEEEQELRFTNELIKYHPENDLALIRISPVARRPIPIYRGERPVRGQKVVAIGSPLGLFNTVSDGIIAGFRNIGYKSMIQFTAPISNGSSGGALLNLYGELIGIVTAGYDEGQNLNLAVDYENVQNFLHGFI